jgi:hypothetical protein
VYRLDIDEEFERKPVRDGFGWETIRFQLALDFDADILVYMTLAFARKEARIYELRFGTEECRLSREEFSEGMDYSIEQSKRYIPKEHRPRVLGLLLEAIGAILKSARPKQVTMQSFYGGLQEKAMVKYEKITSIFVRNGYIVAEDFLGTNNKRYWLFNLPD